MEREALCGVTDLGFMHLHRIALVVAVGNGKHDPVTICIGISPVSYTHLDVYKRQTTDSLMVVLSSEKCLHEPIDQTQAFATVAE